MNANPIGSQSQEIPAPSSAAKLCTDVCSSSFQGDIGDLEGLGEKTKEAPLLPWALGRMTVSPPLVGIFSFAWCAGVTQLLSSELSLRRNWVHLICPPGWQLRRLLCHHLGLELQVTYFYVFSASPEAKAGDRQGRLVGPHVPGILGQRAFSEKGLFFFF